jgi:7-keto-8-aminopelargonate synthetase-like enzyme
VPLEAQNLGREGRLVANCRVDAVPSASEVDSGGARWLNGSTDDVLGLASDPRVREAFLATLRKVGLHRPAQSQVQLDLEHRLSQLLGRPAAVVSELGSVLRALPTWRFAVEARSAALAQDATPVATPDQADALLRQGSLLGLLVEALHPREGDLAPLPRYAELCDRSRTTLVTVDALGLGALGSSGGGACQHLAITPTSGLALSSLGAALPGAGTVVVGDAALLNALRGQLEAPLAAPLAATAKALEVLEGEPQRRARMFDVAQRLLDGLRERALDTGPAVTPWIPVWVGEPLLCQRWLEALAEAAVAMRAHLVPGASRLLLSLSATTSDAQLTQLLEVIDKTARKLGVPLAPPAANAPVEVARPGSYAIAAPCAERWLAPRLVEADPAEEPSAPSTGLGDRVFDTVETFTWRATKVSNTSIRWTADALRALFDRRRR